MHTPTTLEPLFAIAIEWQQARNRWKLRVLDLAIAQDWLPRMVLNTEDRLYIESAHDMTLYHSVMQWSACGELTLSLRLAMPCCKSLRASQGTSGPQEH